MDTCSLSDWNTDVGFESPIPSHRKSSLGLENELVELLWENGDVVLHSQTQRKQPTTRPSDDETISWITNPIDESFENEFSANFLSDFNNVFPNSQLPPPRFEAFGSRKTRDLDLKMGLSHTGRKNPLEGSIMTIGSSHCASNQVNNEMDMSYGGSRTFEENYTETCTREQAITTSSGGSGSSVWKPSDVCNDTNRHKRKKCDMQESQCQSDATELESEPGNKSSQKPGTSRRTRVAEVHNLSERRRRDRINEKMRALQELIPHSNKSDKASMLDEAIEYMKSLQLQIQLMWMGSGMAPMMLPSMQHYMSRLGTGPTPPMHPAIQNLMRLSRFPIGDQAINMAQTANQLAPTGQTHPMLGPVFYQAQMQNSRLAEQYANYMGFHTTQSTLQPINMFNFGAHSAQQNHVLAPPGNGNGLVG